jgi:hypothetical protein
MTTKILLAAAALAAWPALAHDGHGLPGASHWHTWDVMGVALVAVAAGGIWWLGRRK